MEKLETKVYEIDPRKLKKLAKNARYMTGDQLKRLKNNIENDGCLTSVPLVYREDEGSDDLTILSGNHRTEGAIQAGVELIWVMEIITRLTPEQQIAIALSHNSITGQDDESILRELYDSLNTLDYKAYSGLTDDMVKNFEPLDISSVNIGGVDYQEVTLMFLPDEAQEFTRQIERVGKSARKLGMAAKYEDFDRFFEATVKAKDLKNILNNAIAVRYLADLAIERLEQLEAEAEAHVAEEAEKPAEAF